LLKKVIYREGNERLWSALLDLTGDIGSGKSTLVGAMTKLLAPSHRIAYN